DHLHVDGVGRDLDREAHGLLHATGVGDVERDVGHLARGHIHLLDAAVSPEDNGAVVGRPADRRIDAVDGPGLLQVAVEAGEDRRLTTRLDVHHIEHRLVADAPDEGDRLAVRRGGRADRAAGAGDVGLDLAGLAIQPADDVDLAVDVLRILEGVPARRVVAEIEIAAIGRDRRFAGVLLGRAPLAHLHAAAAAAVIRP